MNILVYSLLAIIVIAFLIFGWCALVFDGQRRESESNIRAIGRRIERRGTGCRDH